MNKGDVLYTSADYWNIGSRTRKILVAELDVPASVKLNAERGAKFNLPSGPNEIVVGFESPSSSRTGGWDFSCFLLSGGTAARSLRFRTGPKVEFPLFHSLCLD
jgi:hypothetical protein